MFVDGFGTFGKTQEYGEISQCVQDCMSHLNPWVSSYLNADSTWKSSHLRPPEQCETKIYTLKIAFKITIWGHKSRQTYMQIVCVCGCNICKCLWIDICNTRILNLLTQKASVTIFILNACLFKKRKCMQIWATRK